jgi:hypothetical protein
MGYDIAIIRELVEAAFSEEDLSNFCFDHYFSVYEQFTAGQTKSTRVRLLITYAEKNNLIDDLLTRIKQKNPHKYGEFESRLEASPVRQEEKKLQYPSLNSPPPIQNSSAVKRNLKSSMQPGPAPRPISSPWWPGAVWAKQPWSTPG